MTINKTIFTAGPSYTLRLVLLVLASLGLIFADHRFGYLGEIRHGISVLLYPLQSLVDAPSDVMESLNEGFSSRETLLTQNQSLRTENLLLKSQQQKFFAMESENLRLRELLQSTHKVGEHVLISELLSVDLDPFSRQIVINKGSTDGVRVGQSLIDAYGVIGQVVEVGAYSSRALMITDPTHATPVRINRTGMRAIAMGTGAIGDGLELPHIPNSADIEQGDLLVTSGLGGRFPPGYPVAQITKIETDPSQPYAKISAAPVARLDQLQMVLVVWRDEPSPTPPPAPTPAPESAP
ncbi:MAG: rod shape-determining protein MreC [Pseudomonadota bacterium]